MVEITPPRTPRDVDAARALCWEYRDFLLDLGSPHTEVMKGFYPAQKYREITQGLEALHAPPEGGLQLAVDGADVLGCGMFHTLEPGVAEIKRVYLRPGARGTGAGRALMQALIAQCRTQGFGMIRMDTSTPLQRARALYLDLGFREREAYYEVPENARGLLLFFEMAL